MCDGRSPCPRWRGNFRVTAGKWILTTRGSSAHCSEAQGDFRPRERQTAGEFVARSADDSSIGSQPGAGSYATSVPAADWGVTEEVTEAVAEWVERPRLAWWSRLWWTRLSNCGKTAISCWLIPVCFPNVSRQVTEHPVCHDHVFGQISTILLPETPKSQVCEGIDGEEGPSPWVLDLHTRDAQDFVQRCQARLGLLESCRAESRQALFYGQFLEDLGAVVV